MWASRGSGHIGSFDRRKCKGPLNLNDRLIALKDGKMIVLRVPYPLGFYAKGFDGRIDDPNAGWKGRGLWTTSGDRAPWLMEGGKGKKPIAVHFQLRGPPRALSAAWIPFRYAVAPTPRDPGVHAVSSHEGMNRGRGR